MLLDDMWILRAYPSVLSEYQKKVSALSREKRKLQKAEDGNKKYVILFSDGEPSDSNERFKN